MGQIIYSKPDSLEDVELPEVTTEESKEVEETDN